MNELSLTPDDPKLTAYALGELEGEKRVEVEAMLRLNPALRAAVDEIRATAAQLETALAAEPEAESIAAAARNSPMHEPAADEYRRVKRGPIGKLLQFPQIYYVISGIAAACFAVMAALRAPVTPPKPMHSSAEPVLVRVPITFEHDNK